MNKASYIEPAPAGAGYEEAMWHAVDRRRERRARRAAVTRIGAGAAVTLALAASLLLWVGRPASIPVEAPLAWSGRVLETSSEPARITLADASVVSVHPATRLELANDDPRELRLELRRGGGHFEVARQVGRRFVVGTPAVEVRVVGTRFSVVLEGQRGGSLTRVSVDEGVVEVADRRSGAVLRQLHAGQSWSETLPPPPASAPASASASSAPAEPPQESRPAPSGPPAASERASEATQLLDEANRARARGDYAAAIRAYQAVVDRHPKHPTAALAALELGRLKMYKGGDPSGAAAALQQSLRGDPTSPLREDSMARLVEAYDRAGESSKCAQARDAYLKEYPTGVHAAEVRGRCSAR